MKAYQLKISFADEKPPVWKRVVIPHGITYSQLYYIITVLFDLSKLEYFWQFDFEYREPKLLIYEQFDETRTDVENGVSKFINDEFDHYNLCNLYVGNYSEPTEGKDADPPTLAGQFLSGEEKIDHLITADKYHSGVNFVINIEKILEDHSENYPVLLKTSGSDPLSNQRPTSTDKEIQEKLISSCSISYLDDHLFPSLSDMVIDPETLCGMIFPKSESYSSSSSPSHDAFLEVIKGTAPLIDLIESNEKILSEKEQERLDSGLMALALDPNDITKEEMDEIEAVIVKTLQLDSLIPESFSKHLLRYSKDGLLSLCKNYELTKLSSMNKNELADKVSAVLLEETTLLNRLSELDPEDLMLLKNTAENGGIAILSENNVESAYVLNAELFGVVTLQGTFLTIPKDTIQPILGLLTEEYMERAEKVFWLNKCLYFFEWIYIAGPLDLLVQIVNSKRGYNLSKDDILELLDDERVDTADNFTIDGDDIVVSAALEVISFINALRKAQQEKDFYIPRESDIEIFSDRFYPANEPAYMKMKDFLTELCNDSYNADLIVINVFRTIANREDKEEIYDLLNELDVRFSVDKSRRKFNSLFNEVTNNTRSAWVSGNRPIDITKRSALMAKRVKVGRNEPCPCGSGKKYKHCCGKVSN